MLSQEAGQEAGIVRIEPLDPRNATDEQVALGNRFFNTIRAESRPEDPPVPLDEEAKRTRAIPSIVELSTWCAFDGERLVGWGETDFVRTAQRNRHVVDLGVWVLPDQRRRGIATRLLAKVIDLPLREARRLVITHSTSTVPAGAAFLERIGARMGLAMHEHDLDLATLDRGLIERWIEQGEQRAGGEFGLGWWDNEYPESSIEEIAAMFDALNRAPRGDLDLEDFQWTVEELREFERWDRATGNEIWTLYARHRATGRIAGWTEVGWHPNRPHILEQRGTGVFPEFQGRGLGKWLKAAMLERVMRERPQVQHVRTANAFENAPMLAINTTLGFRPHFSRYTWQVETERVVAYLGERGIDLP
jgi:GNAT superfamily N-acetyltransferase